MFRHSIATLGGASALYVLVDENRRQKSAEFSRAVMRIGNLVKTVGFMSFDYGRHVIFHNNISNEVDILLERLNILQNDQEVYTAHQMKSKTKEERQKWTSMIQNTRNEIDRLSDQVATITSKKGVASSISPVHKKNAERLRQMCIKNKGIYIKLGQHLSQLDHVVPEEYIEAMQTLLGSAPQSSFDDVTQVIREELGHHPNELFASFSPLPIASASLAQVHVAHDLISGKKLAIKVQHLGLREGSVGDRMAITFIVEILSKIFDEFDYRWLTREMNNNLPVELDFNQEARNLLKCKGFLKELTANGDVVLPTIHKASERVLVMGFEEGVYVSGRACDEIGVKKSDVARLISTTFCHQIFQHGFVHCDPHEANLLIRPHPNKMGYPQLVLLDHGLYRNLDDKFKNDYCRLWQALVTADEKEIKKRCANMNAGKIYTLLAAMLTMKPWDDIVADDNVSRMKAKGTKGESEMLKSYAKKYFKQVVGLLRDVPSELLLLFKTNDCLRHIDRSLGVPVNTIQIIGNITAEVNFKADFFGENVEIMEKINALIVYIKVKTRMLALSILDILFTFNWRRAFFSSGMEE